MLLEKKRRVVKKKGNVNEQVKLKFVTCVNSIGRKTLRGFDSSDALSLFVAFYGQAFSWQCSSAFDFRSKTFLAPHLRTENRDKRDKKGNGKNVSAFDEIRNRVILR